MAGWIPGLDQVTGTFTLPLWAAATPMVVFLVACFLALGKAGAGTTFRALTQVAIVLFVAVAGWAFFNQSALRDRDTERRALDARALELTARAVTPGSPLACLDVIAGETIENACENALFASAETTAAALSYVAARLTLLADAMSYANRRDPSYESVLSEWRRTLETDRFGLVAQVMATRDGCSADQCPAFSLLRDPSRVGTNLAERAFDQHVARYAGGWGTRGGTPVATTAPGATAAAPPGMPSLAASSTSGPVFPSAASIPPVSIMNAEPTGSVQQGQPAAAATTAATEPITNPPTPPRRPPPRPPPTAAPAVPAPGLPPSAQ